MVTPGVIHNVKNGTLAIVQSWFTKMQLICLLCALLIKKRLCFYLFLSCLVINRQTINRHCSSIDSYLHRAVRPLLVADKVIWSEYHFADITMKTCFVPILPKMKESKRKTDHESLNPCSEET